MQQQVSLLPVIVSGLADDSDDVRAAAVDALIPMATVCYSLLLFFRLTNIGEKHHDHGQ